MTTSTKIKIPKTHVSEIIKEYQQNLSFEVFSIKEYYKKYAISSDILRKINTSKKLILEDAIKLQEIYGRPVEMWLNLQENFDNYIE